MSASTLLLSSVWERVRAAASGSRERVLSHPTIGVSLPCSATSHRPADPFCAYRIKSGTHAPSSCRKEEGTTAEQTPILATEASAPPTAQAYAVEATAPFKEVKSDGVERPHNYRIGQFYRSHGTLFFVRKLMLRKCRVCGSCIMQGSVVVGV